MYFFEGKDYSKLPSTEDERRFELMLGERSDEEDEKKEGRVLRHKSGVSPRHTYSPSFIKNPEEGAQSFAPYYIICRNF